MEDKEKASFQTFWLWLVMKASDTWWPEIMGICFSIICSVGVGVILALFNGSQVPHLPQSLTLNAMISVLATGSKSAMLFVIASCLGQVKWIWFQKKSLLLDVQTLDDASRGPSGALSLLFTRLIRSIAGLGAAITILSLTFDPFVQQILTYPSFPVTEISLASTTKQSLGIFTPDLLSKFEAAIYRGIWSDDFKPTPICAAGDCEWDLIETVGWCSKCQPVAAQVITACNTTFTVGDFGAIESNDDSIKTLVRPCAVELDNLGRYDWDIEANYTDSYTTEYSDDAYSRFVISTQTGAIWNVSSIYWDYDASLLSWPTFSSDRSSVNNISYPVLVLGIANFMYSAEHGNMSVEDAQVCTFDICERDYRISVTAGIGDAELVNVRYGSKFMIRSEDVGTKFTFASDKAMVLNQSETIFPLRCWSADGTVEGLHLEDREFIFDELVIANNDTIYLDESHLAFCCPHSSVAISWFWALPIAEAVKGYQLSHKALSCALKFDECRDRLFDPPLSNVDRVSVSTITHSSTNMRHIWQQGPEDVLSQLADSLTKLSLDSSWVNVPGRTVSIVPFVKVRWVWFILPAMLNLGTLYLFIYIYVQTMWKKANLWKSSSAALLFHGLDHETLSVPTPSRVSEMNERASLLQVRLQESRTDGRVVLGTEDYVPLPTTLKGSDIQAVSTTTSAVSQAVVDDDGNRGRNVSRHP